MHNKALTLINNKQTNKQRETGKHTMNIKIGTTLSISALGLGANLRHIERQKALTLGLGVDVVDFPHFPVGSVC